MHNTHMQLGADPSELTELCATWESRSPQEAAVLGSGRGQ